MYDENLVSVELLAAHVQITQPSEIALYVKGSMGCVAWPCTGQTPAP